MSQEPQAEKEAEAKDAPHLTPLIAKVLNLDRTLHDDMVSEALTRRRAEQEAASVAAEKRSAILAGHRAEQRDRNRALSAVRARHAEAVAARRRERVLRVERESVRSVDEIVRLRDEMRRRVGVAGRQGQCQDGGGKGGKEEEEDDNDGVNGLVWELWGRHGNVIRESAPRYVDGYPVRDSLRPPILLHKRRGGTGREHGNNNSV